ncbi:FliM/FliN family flagellar motor switch protein [Skermanella pratensis]|uniref:FliM/FliN family flagellar motor switch protein n=1 Tax=Skermanella pratensis TaxID=2233999 RepID=UPI001300F6DB|nr:FliM/FliN family flagellar motor switch protein [Skermanella pratensis]
MADIHHGGLIDQPNGRIAEYLAAERPQAVAAALFMVQPDRAAAILSGMDAERRALVLGRMRRSRDLAPHVRERLERAIGEDMRSRPETAGARHFAAVLAALPEGLHVPEPPAQPEPESAADTERAGGGTGSAALDDRTEGMVESLLALVNGSAVSVGRLPMLEVALDRFVRLFQMGLAELCGERAVLSLHGIRAVRLGDYLHEPDRRRALYGIFRCVDWDHSGMLAAGRGSTGVIADLVLGDPDPPEDAASVASTGTASTGMERAAFAIFCETLLASLGDSLEPIAPGRFELGRLLDDPRFVTIDRPANTAIVVDFRLGRGAGHRFDLILPSAALEPFRARLSRRFEGEKFGHDPFWAAGMREHLLKADARLRVVADGVARRLAEVAAWRPGSPVPLRGPVRAKAGGITVALGRIGGRNNLRTLEVDRITIFGEDATMTEALDGTATSEVESAPAVPKLDFAALGEVRMRVSVVIGGTDMTIADLLRIGRGAVLELDRRVDEQVDILVNDRAVAKGRIVIIEDQVAVAVEELL